MQYVNYDLYPLEFGLHQKYARVPLLLDLVWTHCHITSEIALQLYDRETFDTSHLDRNLLVQACLLHDVGVYLSGGFEWIPEVNPCDCTYSTHTLIGAWILQQEQFHPLVVQSAFTHTGVGLTPDDIQQFAMHLPSADYTPTNPFTELVAYASKFHSKAPHFKDPDHIKETLSKYGAEKTKRFENWELKFGIPDLAPLEETYHEWHERIKSQIEQLGTHQLAQTNLNPAGISSAHVVS